MQQELASVFPLPPYYQHFTAENVEAAKQYTADSAPPHLQYLFPPPAPVGDDATYLSFGSVWPVKTKLPTLEEMGIQNLSNIDHEQPVLAPVEELQKLSRSLILQYLELLGCLTNAPEQFPTHIDNMRTLFINMHHLINMYRPHQARESLVSLLEQQRNKKLAHTKEVRETCDQIEALLEKTLPKEQTNELKVDGSNAEPNQHDLSTNPLVQDIYKVLNQAREIRERNESMLKAGRPSPKDDDLLNQKISILKEAGLL
ncbi:hypothetical protein CANCADRAFT_1369 [Tortispora caseinolytica NRRL Y-17796]|uniref:Mediator of RNA polymerase II transcription subunit 7 n=1 Tax=Tortispora caseinolytica NRRL Y-17796 TaxID=767744 RepID=A0A1E4TLX9_9ASCO|nr:hypothetical protein CANCADRAFT_1369 [Tortispora caseinolytica NRRL Y-17796]